jgi:gliding motility-associated protein GldM
MAGGKETPRQKMIGMMYLVLTALLALNVSKEILEAFVVVNEGLERTSTNFASRNAILYKVFDDQESNNPDKVRPFNNKAKEVRKLSDEMFAYIHEIKRDLIAMEDGVPAEVADTTQVRNIQNKDKYDNTTNMMCGTDIHCRGARATELKEKIDEFREALLSKVKGIRGVENFSIGLFTEDPPSRGTETISWESNKFYHLPLAAVITLLSQMQTEIRNAEGEVVNKLLGAIDAESFKVDNVVAQVIPSSGFVLIGDEFTAKIFVAAYSSTLQPRVVVGGREITDSEDGMAIYKSRPTTEGEQTVKGSVFMKGPDGDDKELPFETKFIASRPTAVVSPTKMNVFYIGVPNPVSISVPGVAPSNVSVSMEGAGTVTYNPNGESVVNVTQPGKCKINVSAKTADGKTSPMGSLEFRIKRIPNPVAKILGKEPGASLSVAEIRNAGGLTAVLDNFDFEAKFTVISYEVSTPSGGLDNRVVNTGARFSTEAESRIINKLKPGSKLYFDDIIVQGPDGTKRTLTASFKII